jgi:hypothetical protein
MITVVGFPVYAAAAAALDGEPMTAPWPTLTLELIPKWIRLVHIPDM